MLQRPSYLNLKTIMILGKAKHLSYLLQRIHFSYFCEM